MARLKQILNGHITGVCILNVVSKLIETRKTGASTLIVSRQHLDEILLQNCRQIDELEQIFFSVLTSCHLHT